MKVSSPKLAGVVVSAMGWAMAGCATEVPAPREARPPAGALSPQVAPVVPFLARDAVVRESQARVRLAGEGGQGPAIVVTRAPDGPGRALDEGRLREAARVLARSIEAVTGARCAVASDASGRPSVGAQEAERNDAASGRPSAPSRATETTGEGEAPSARGGESARSVTREEGSESGGAIRRIVVGVATPEEGLAPLDEHGFVVRTREAGPDVELRVEGGSAAGALFGAWFFVARYAGVRVVLPGELGLVHPRRVRLDVPRALFVRNPAPDFLLRYWSGPGGFDPAAWLADTASTQRFEYHHNLHRIYAPDRIGAGRARVFPVVAGRPTPPEAGKTSGWQPTFSEPETAAAAIEYADEAFAARPDLRSISLAVNDGLGYSEVDVLRGTLAPDGTVSVSDVYYGFVNEVARAVGRKHPGRFVAVLPYNLVRSPPSFSLEPNVLPFFLNEPKAALRAWGGRVGRFGIYQWLYGMGRVLPNHFPRALKDYLRWARSAGAVAFKGEAYPVWAFDGPKLWVLANLLWNVEADVDALLDDYYQSAYGAAAPAMARFFARAEAIYERRRSGDEYRLAPDLYPGERQLDDVRDDDLAAMDAALREAQARAEGRERARVDAVATCFRWGKLHYEQLAALRRVARADVRSDADAEAVIASAQAFADLDAEREAFRRERVAALPQLCAYSEDPRSIDWKQADPRFSWAGLDAAFDAGLGRITAHLRRTGSPERAIAFWERVERERPFLAPFAATQRLVARGEPPPLANLLEGGSFEQPPAPGDPAERVARGFSTYHNRMVAAAVSIDEGRAADGSRSLTARGITDCSGVIRLVKVPRRARYRLSLSYRTSKEARHAFVGVLFDREIREHLPRTTEWARWEKVFTIGDGPGADASFHLLLCLADGASPAAQVWFDDVRLERLSPEGIAR